MLDDLSYQYQWAGTGLVNLGLLVCPECLDVPQEQFRTIVLPPDPVPRINPRIDVAATPEWDRNLSGPLGPQPTTPGNAGFTQYVLGSPTLGNYPQGKSAVLAAVAKLSGVPTPNLGDASFIFLTANQSVAVLDPAARGFLLIYNPVQSQAQLALTASATWGVGTNLAIGPGEAWFWATAQGLGQAWSGPLAAISLSVGAPLWVWTDVGVALPEILLEDSSADWGLEDGSGSWEWG